MSDGERRSRMGEDQAVARLRASDPGAGAEPDAGRLARLTSERRGDELAARRARGPRRWTSVAAIAAGALVVGGAGYGIGASTDPSGDAITLATVDRAGSDDVAVGPAIGGTTEEMATAPHALSLSSPQNRTTFSASGLSSQTTRASAWAFDGPAAYGADTAARAADVLGVPGEPVDRHGGWWIGADDGTGPSLELGSDGAVSLHFNDPELYELIDHDRIEPMPLPAPDDAPARGSDDGDSTGTDTAVTDGDEAEASDVAPPPDEPTASPDDEPTSAPVEPDDGVVAAPDGLWLLEPIEPAPQPQPEDPADLTGEAAVLHRTLTELGIDADSAEYVSGPFGIGEEIVSVTAYQLVDGHRTGYEWTAAVVGDRVYSFSGPLAPVVALGEYDVVSPVEAVDRLADPRFGGTQVWTNDFSVLPFAEEPSGWTWGDPPGAPPAAGAAIPWAVTDVVIVAAELTLTQQSTDAGSILLLPAYELSDADGRTWSVLAVADHELAF